MSLEQSIANLQAQTGLLLDLPQQLRDTCDTQIARVTNAYNDRINTLTTECWVDQRIGDDDNSGAEDSPFASIERAVDEGVYGGRVEAHLIDDYEVREDVRTKGRHLTVLSANNQAKSRITFERSITTSGGQQRRVLKRFIPTDNGTILFNNIAYTQPDVGGFGSASVGQLSHTISSFSATSDTMLSVAWWLCEMDIPANAFGSLIGWENRPLSVLLSACTFPNAPVEGHLLAQYTDTAGTDANTIPQLITNLATV